MRYIFLAGIISLSAGPFLGADQPLVAPRPDREISPVELDRLIVAALQVKAESFEICNDATFLRRATLDLIGRVPTIEEQRIFANDRSPDKRKRLIQRLLQNHEFGRNQANYWSDTIAYHVAPPQLTFLDYGPLKQWLADEFNANRSWDQIVTKLLTSTGKVADEPAATFVAYHQGNPAKLAAETARIFLGMQIQCAECHDHPFDDWKRKDFHSLAAFFARTKVKMPWNEGDQTVVSDKGKGEYTMPDADPSKKGTEMQPVFLDGAAFESGTSDLDRRRELANLLTDENNRWFARAFVNRLWAQFTGEGFYNPVDNMGVNQIQSLPEVHEALTTHFLATHYDVKSVFALLMNTRFYQRAIQTVPGDSPSRIASLAPSRLRGDEVFDSLESALAIPVVKAPTAKPTDAVRFPEPNKSVQDVVVETFGYDPSFGPKLVPRNMAQAMLMMNNEELQAQVNADPASGTVLSRLLKTESDDAKVVETLFELMLARKPTAKERALCAKHLAQVKDRGDAFEDLLWSLMNSTEFTTRR